MAKLLATREEQLYNVEHMYELGLKSLKRDRDLSDRNKELILQFTNYLMAKGTTKMRVRTVYFPKFKIICNASGKDLDKFTREDVEKVMAHVQVSGYAPGTVNHFVTVFKIFYKWLEKVDTSHHLNWPAAPGLDIPSQR